VRGLSALARFHLADGRPRESIDLAREAVERLSRLVSGVSDVHAASARGVYSEAFGVGAQAAARVDDATAALYFIESGRAGALLEALKVRNVLAASELPPELAEADRAARSREVEAANALRRAVESGSRATMKTARAEFDAAQQTVVDVVDRIQREAKAAASVAYPKADSLDAIRSRLREDEALVLYRLMANDLGGAMALVVTSKGARIVALGNTADVEAQCVSLHADDATADAGVANAALRRLVIDALQLDATTRRVLVSPDGVLSYVPFALLAPEKEFVYVPSGTTYGVLLEDAAKRGDGVLALGDPDYGVKPSDGIVAMRGGGYGNLVRLPATGVEAKAVGTVTLLGRDATESGLRDALANKPRWRAIHIACHGLVDPDQPMFSSLALTPAGEDDGFLTALEVFRMKCPADLVVLSACETGKGKVYKAEGIVGLTRAFMFAGAPRVLVSLWKVDDDATRALMTKFYELWNAKDGKGAGAAAALRGAQEFVRSQAKWKHPRFWAAWVLWGLPD
jgi:CHAT domain-containing protein